MRQLRDVERTLETLKLIDPEQARELTKTLGERVVSQQSEHGQRNVKHHKGNRKC
jgi:hypothetical protein